MSLTKLADFLRRHWRQGALWLCLWGGVMLACAVQDYVACALNGTTRPWLLILRRCGEEWLVWGLLSIPVLWLARRFPLEPGCWRRSLWIHLGSNLLVMGLFSLMVAALLDGQVSISGNRFVFREVLVKLLFVCPLMMLLLYWGLVLGYQGWRYYRQFREREQQANALAVELVEARLEALRMQLNPHFLFNTLHTISALIHANPPAADRMVVKLSELLRRTLAQSDSHEVPLHQEVELLGGYLEIEQTRFQDRLTVEVRVEPGTEDLLVPCLILQPLVENAIRHAIEPRETPGRIQVAAHRHEGWLELVVRDDGPGLPETQGAGRPQGIGLANTRSRLAHLYGPDHQLVLDRAAGGGLEVRLRIPCRQERRREPAQVLAQAPGQEANSAAPKVPPTAWSDPATTRA